MLNCCIIMHAQILNNDAPTHIYILICTTVKHKYAQICVHNTQGVHIIIYHDTRCVTNAKNIYHNAQCV